MAKYIIHKTNPFGIKPAFSISEFTSSGPVFPIVNLTGPQSLSIDTSLFLFGKGQPNYGERIQENFVRLLENFAGHSEPVSPVVGQLWFKEITVLRTNGGNDWWEWDEGSGLWVSFIPQSYNPSNIAAGNHGDYFFDNTTGILYRKVDLPQHPLSGSVIKIAHNVLPTVTDPNAENIKPIKNLSVWNGSEWVDINNVVATSVPTSIFYENLYLPQEGSLWFDTSDQQLKIYTSSGWTSVADKYLPLSGGTMDSGANIVLSGGTLLGLPSTPTDPTEAVSKDYVDSLVFGAVPSLQLNDLTDVNVTGAPTNSYLKFNGTDWYGDTLQLNDISGITVTETEVNQLSGVTGNIQTQIDSKVSKSGDSMTGILDMSSNRIINLATPIANADATTKQYVDNRISNEISTALTNYLPLSGGNLTGPLDLGNNNITSLADPVNLTDATNRQWVENYVTNAFLSTPISLDGLSDVTITTPQVDHSIFYDGIQWVNRFIVTSDIKDLAVTSTEINQLSGVTDNVQSQINNRVTVNQLENLTTLRRWIWNYSDVKSNQTTATNTWLNNPYSDYLYTLPFKFKVGAGVISVRVTNDNGSDTAFFYEAQRAYASFVANIVDPFVDTGLTPGTTYNFTVTLDKHDGISANAPLGPTTTNVYTINIAITVPSTGMTFQDLETEINNQLSAVTPDLTCKLIENRYRFLYDKIPVAVGSTNQIDSVYELKLTDGTTNPLIASLPSGSIDRKLMSTTYAGLGNTDTWLFFVPNAAHGTVTNQIFCSALMRYLEKSKPSFVEFVIHGKW